jgi:hypothetical protein
MRWISFEDSEWIGKDPVTHEDVCASQPHLRLLEVHHMYWGLFAQVTGFVWIFKLPAPWIGLVLAAIGTWWSADDAWQHYKQRSDPYYTSPVHDLWVWLAEKWRR